MLAQQLFTFVTATPVKQPNGEVQPVGATNEAERTLPANVAGSRICFNVIVGFNFLTIGKWLMLTRPE